MDLVASDLAVYLLERLNDLPLSSRLCVGISGAPGAGKTTLSARIQSHVNALHKASHPNAQVPVGIVVPLDGWHLTRSTLDTFPDPKLAHDRRGAHWTFDGDSIIAFDREGSLKYLREGNGYVSFVKRLREPISAEDVTAPSFSHSLKDPVFDDIAVRPQHRIVIIEGLYVFLGIDPWVNAARSLDERWFVATDAKEGKQRLCRRHVVTGVAANWEEAVWRADNNDIPNGEFVEANMLTPTRRIFSMEDPSLPLTI